MEKREKKRILCAMCNRSTCGGNKSYVNMKRLTNSFKKKVIFEVCLKRGLKIWPLWKRDTWKSK